jgi:hypothetical protein
VPLFKRICLVAIACAFALTPPATATTSYSTTVLNASPVAYYRLNETSGTTAHDLTGHFNATYNGSPALNQPPLILNTTDPSVKFDGSNDYVNANSVSSHTSWPGITMEAWVEFTRAAPTNEEHVMNFSTAKGGHAPGLFHDSPTNKVKFAVGSSTSYALSDSPISSGVHYLVGTVGTNNVSRLYIDGQLQKQTGTISVRPQAGWLFAIGCDHDYGPVTTSFWRGRIDEVAIYDHALTQTQITAHYTAGH